MEIVQLIEVEGNILTFEDDQGRKIVFPVDKKLAEEYKKILVIKPKTRNPCFLNGLKWNYCGGKRDGIQEETI